MNAGWIGRRSNGCRAARRAFTLAEVVLSLSVMSIVTGAAVSAMLMVSHALPDDERDAAAETWEALLRLEQDLAYAATFSKTDLTNVEFEVDDRGHGAAGEEEFRFEWSGDAGDPLTREYNGGAVVAILDDVQHFRLTYHTAVDAKSGDTKLCSITIELQSGSDTANRLQTEVRILNGPTL
jgi:prepilin-type N-terminal cleavage/methylation domain-containing protein